MRILNWQIDVLSTVKAINKSTTKDYHVHITQVEDTPWYRELQNVVTIDGKTLKSEYKMSAASHLKGYNMAQCEIDRNNIPKKLTFIGVWNNRSNDIKIGYLNVINNVDFRSSTIQLQKCLGCELDNIEQSNKKNYNCNILVNANDCLIVGVQSNNAYHRSTFNNNNLKAILQTNLLDITDLSYNDFLFKNNWKSYEASNRSAMSINHLIKINDNLITKLLDFSHDQNQLMIIQKQLFESSIRKFEIYTDGHFRSEIFYFPSSNKAELLAIILALIVLSINSEVTIYTNSNNVITGYYDIIDRNNFIILPQKFFKIRMNNIYWSILQEIIVTNNLTLDFIKIKGHSDNYFNNYVDQLIVHTDNVSNLTFKENNLNKLDYVSRWNNITIECNLHQFLNKKSMQDETFDHVWICESCANEMNTIICEVKEFFEETCNSLLIKAEKDPIVDDKLINKMTFWDHTYSETKITFIDLIKGIIFMS
ncbi:unnamed protein product [Rhizophagus irregularis]|nr:unnamed protein product [Rhizophagus irregularis]